MKRDMELVRKILLHTESAFVYESLSSTDIHIDGYTDEQIGYHLRILEDGGLIDVIDTNGTDSRTFSCFIRGITWQGHEFLDSVRNEGVWQKVCQTLKPLGTASLAVIMSLATSLAKKELGLP